MAYIGQNADGNFTTTPAKDTFNGDGSTVAFTLSQGGSTNTVDVFVENVRQEPTEAYSVDGTTLTFTEAPGTGTGNIYVVNRGPAQLTATHPAGQALEAYSGTFSTSVAAESLTLTGDLTVDTNTLVVDSTNNSVGIGTSSPATYSGALVVADGSAGGATHVTITNNNVNQFIKLGVVGDLAQIGYDDGDGIAFGQFANSTGTSFSSEAMRIDSSGNVGIGTSSPDTKFHVEESGATDLYATFENSNSGGYGAFVDIKSTANYSFSRFTGGTKSWIIGQRGLSGGLFSIYDEDNTAHRMVIDSSGNVLVGKTSDSFSTVGASVRPHGEFTATRTSSHPLAVNRLSTDGNLVLFYQNTSIEGSISVSGTTVSYNGGHLARWSQLTDNTKDEAIVKGTVMTNLDQMAVWSHDAVEAQDAVYDEDGNVVTEAVEAKDAYTEDNEQLNCMSVSSVEGDPNVAGVFVNWDNDDDEFNDMNIAMTGDMVIRIAQGTTVARGDLLMSAGDGTAKSQGDDIVRSKTIAKVTSTNVSHTYDDGSYLVPCVLMAC